VMSICYCGVNPSKADHEIDDQTITKLHEFTVRAGFSRFEVVNLFAYRATNVKELATAVDPVGPLNDMQIKEAFSCADLIVPMWGARGKIPKALWPRIDEVWGMIRDANKVVMTFGETVSGDPKHPLMLPYKTPLKVKLMSRFD
jgi:hypothetical protein